MNPPGVGPEPWVGPPAVPISSLSSPFCILARPLSHRVCKGQGHLANPCSLELGERQTALGNVPPTSCLTRRQPSLALLCRGQPGGSSESLRAGGRSKGGSQHCILLPEAQAGFAAKQGFGGTWIMGCSVRVRGSRAALQAAVDSSPAQSLPTWTLCLPSPGGYSQPGGLLATLIQTRGERGCGGLSSKTHMSHARSEGNANPSGTPSYVTPFNCPNCYIVPIIEAQNSESCPKWDVSPKPIHAHFPTRAVSIETPF